MNGPVVHLTSRGEAFDVPCPRCGRTPHSMNNEDTFTLDEAEATCEAPS